MFKKSFSLALSVLGFFMFISATILFMSCENNNSEPEKYRIIYHGYGIFWNGNGFTGDSENGHTSGEVPVDPNEYKEGDLVRLVPHNMTKEGHYCYPKYNVHHADQFIITSYDPVDGFVSHIPDNVVFSVDWDGIIVMQNKNAEVYITWFPDH